MYPQWMDTSQRSHFTDLAKYAQRISNEALLTKIEDQAVNLHEVRNKCHFLQNMADLRESQMAKLNTNHSKEILKLDMDNNKGTLRLQKIIENLQQQISDLTKEIEEMKQKGN